MKCKSLVGVCLASGQGVRQPDWVPSGAQPVPTCAHWMDAESRIVRRDRVRVQHQQPARPAAWRAQAAPAAGRCPDRAAFVCVGGSCAPDFAGFVALQR